MRTLVWFRGKDLRTADHAPLHAAAQSAAKENGAVIPLFVLDEHFFRPEAAQRTPFRIQFLLESVASLAANLAHLGSKLIVVAGRSTEQLPMLARRWNVDRVVAQSWVAPIGRERDRKVASDLSVPLQLFDTETLCRPGKLRTAAGDPFSVFSAFARVFERDIQVDAALPVPRALPPLPTDVKTPSVALPTLDSLGLTHNPRLPTGGEGPARERLRKWLAHDAKDYDELRNRLDLPGTSRLSADLKFGTLSVRTVWNAVDRCPNLR